MSHYCDQCHISRPRSADGGLVAGHKVKKVASNSNTYLACHGERVGPEFQGKNEGVQGDGTEHVHRFDGPVSPNCLDCHPDVEGGKDGVPQHAIHGEKVACQVCHSVGPYKSCFNCHVARTTRVWPTSRPIRRR